MASCPGAFFPCQPVDSPVTGWPSPAPRQAGLARKAQVSLALPGAGGKHGLLQQVRGGG